MVEQNVLIAGATGYVGGRLLPQLEREGAAVRCLARSPEKLAGSAGDSTRVVAGDLLDAASVERAMEGIETAYYLVHLMGARHEFEEKERISAANFAAAAKKAGVSRIIYLGGLGDEDDPELSPHLRSRHEVGKILRNSGVETIEFRASVIVGHGSLSFEIVKSLTERLPIMICPKWLKTPTQPIAIDDVVAYLLAARRLPAGESRIYEIGASDVVTYGELIRIYAEERGLRRLLVPVPLLTPYLSSLWLGLVTPASARIGRHLIEGLKNPTIVRRPVAEDVFDVHPRPIRQATADALRQEAETRRADPAPAS